MGHHHHHHSTSDTNNLSIAFFLNLLFTIIEIIGGILTNSVAILSDALHDLGDSVSLGLAWYFQKISTKTKDEKYSYGYKRFSLLGAIINAIILLVGGIFILRESIPRLFNPEPAEATGMMALALLGIIVNGAAVFKLKNDEGVNSKMVSLHLLEDVLGWVAVLIGSIIMFFFNMPIIDPILSILITCFVFYNVYRNLGSTLKIILQGTPSIKELVAVRNYFDNLSEINSYHDLHIWSMDGSYNVLTTHIILEHPLSNEAQHTLKCRIKEDLHHLNVGHCTLEFETLNADCDMIEDAV